MKTIYGQYYQNSTAIIKTSSFFLMELVIEAFLELLYEKNKKRI
jgi:hypothetical protein